MFLILSATRQKVDGLVYIVQSTVHCRLIPCEFGSNMGLFYYRLRCHCHSTACPNVDKLLDRLDTIYTYHLKLKAPPPPHPHPTPTPPKKLRQLFFLNNNSPLYPLEPQNKQKQR